MDFVSRSARSRSIEALWTLLLAWLCGSPQSVHAFVIAKDAFLTGGGQYNVASLIGQNPTVAGFSGGWYASAGSAMNLQAASLNYPVGTYPASTGGSIFSPTNSNRVHRLLNAATNPFQSSYNGTVYLSYLYQNSASSNNSYIAFEMHNGGNADGNRTFHLGVGQTDFLGGTTFGFRINQNPLLASPLGPRNTSVNLFVIKFDLTPAAGGDAITVWQNPSYSSPVVDPLGGVTFSGFDFAADRLGVGRFTTDSNFDFAIDELRMGTFFGDVVLNNFLACDINGNGTCNSSDMRIISDNMFQSGDYSDGDLNGDGTINFADYRLLKDDPARVVGFDSPPVRDTQVPEPSGIVLIVFALPFALRRPRGAARGYQKTLVTFSALLIGGGLGFPLQSHAQTQPTGPITTFSGATLHMKRYANIPSGPIISMTTQPLTSGNQDLFVTTQNGSIYSLRDNGGGSISTSLFFNYNTAVSQFVANPNNGFVLDNTNTIHGGLRNITFHPEFALNGKFYTSALVDTPTGVPGLRYIGPTLGTPAAESLVAEWTYDRQANELTDYRELFRVQMPVFDHPVKQMGFNNFAKPGDDDYGLLYIAHGDGSQASTTTGGGTINNALGKILRISPLESGPNPYTTPGNVLAGQPGYLPEIYTLGHRNPHHLSFAKDANGDTHVIVAEPGRDNIEEVNVLQNGGNYGWSSREGTWVQLPGSGGYGVGVGVQNLPANEWQLNDFIYPAAQYDHDTNFGSTFAGISIAGGFTIQNNTDPALQDEYIFLDHANGNGRVYQAGLAGLLGAHTQLADGELPAALTQAQIKRLHLTLDTDGDGDIDRTSDDMNTLLQQSRNDGRFGRGPNGEMFISSKTTGQVYLVNNTVPDVDRLTLTVDRGTGDMTISNSSGSNVAINSLSLTSPSGSIAPLELQTLGTGWSLSGSNTMQMAAQSNSTGSLNFGGTTTAPLGDAYDAQLFAFGQPAGEDVVFVFETASGNAVLGNVVYTGESQIRDTIVMTVNLATGEAVVLNETPFAQEVEGYTITSPLGSINTAGWNSFEMQGIDDGDWFASPAEVDRLTEIQDDGTTTFDENTPYSLGEIFSLGEEQDLKFEFLLAGESDLREGLVVYLLPGDFDGDLDVDGRDFLAWQRGASPNPFSSTDLATWQASYGTTITGPLAAFSVPEPGCAVLVGLYAVLCLSSRGRLAD
ncbi:MAG: PQQ-dependent sugar dehydrogenase [Bythopirellula sp.]|nr:PQQ-dependent sugar dehydrogenase [Bythopirellula sp.]